MTDVSIVIHHHPSSAMTEECQREIARLITNTSDVVIFGHVHNPKPALHITPDERLVSLQAAALHAKGDAFQGYALLEYDTETISYRTFFSERGRFDAGNNVGVGGTVFFGKALEKKSADLLIKDLKRNATEEIIGLYDENLIDKGLSGIWVEPKIVRILQSIDENDAGSTYEVDADIKDIIMSDGDVVIGSSTESGSTSLFKTIQKRVTEDASSHAFCSLISSSPLPTYEAKITRDVLRGLPPSIVEFVRTNPKTVNIVILIDRLNLIETDTQFFSICRKLFPRCRFIVGIDNSALEGDGINVEVHGTSNVETFVLRSFNRRRVRSLIRNWDLPASFKTDDVLNEVMERFRVMGIPITPAYLVFYLTVLERTQTFAPMNASTIVDQFIATVLERYNVEEIFRKSFDYRNQTAVLASIARYMTDKDVEEVEYDECILVVKNFLTEIDILYSAPTLVDEFVRARILERNSDRISFKNNLFKSYFIALAMSANDEFREKISSAPVSYHFVTAIELYCGLNRGDRRIWTQINKDYDILRSKLEENLPVSQIRKNVASLVLEGDNNIDIDELVNKILEGDIDESTRDELLDRESDNNQTKEKKDRRKQRRSEIKNEALQWIYSLRLLTVSLKNLEHISAVEKNEGLRKTLEGWAILLALGFLILSEIIENDQFTIGGHTINFNLNNKNAKDAFKQLLNWLPLVVSDMLRSHLATEKLALSFARYTADQSSLENLLLSFIMLDLQIDNPVDRLESIREDSKNFNYIKQSILIKTVNFYLRQGSPRTVGDDKFRRLIVNLQADKGNLAGSHRYQFVDRSLNRIRKRRLIVQGHERADKT